MQTVLPLFGVALHWLVHLPHVAVAFAGAKLFLATDAALPTPHQFFYSV